VVKRKVLFTTPIRHRDLNFFGIAMPYPFINLRLVFPPFGLRFLRENVPGIETLEYPSWGKFERALSKKVDVLGISFYTYEIPIVKEMVRIARREYGVKEIWGGNYGVLTPGVEELFDKIFIGYAEEQVYETVYEKPFPGPLHHPSIVVEEYTPLVPFVRGRMGILFTHRGCNLKCTFCQTPVFSPTISPIPFDEVKKTLLHYHQKGVKVVLFAEENFNPYLNRELISLIQSLGMRWFAQTRLDYIHNRVKELVETGFIGGLFGLESFNEKNLKFLDKREAKEKMIETLFEMEKYELFVQGTYIFGFEDDIEESIKRDIEFLNTLPLMVYHIFVLTPLPRTPLAHYIESKFGVFEKDWSRFDCLHLTWNHPHISREKMDRLVRYAKMKGWTIKRYLRTIARIYKKVRVSFEPRIG